MQTRRTTCSRGWESSPPRSWRPGAAQREYCHPDVLRSLRRRSLAALRREVEPVTPDVLARFLPAWHGIEMEVAGQGRGARGARAGRTRPAEARPASPDRLL